MSYRSLNVDETNIGRLKHTLTRPKSSVEISQLIFSEAWISLTWWSCKSDEPNTNFGPFNVRTTSPSEPSLVMRTNRPPSNGNIFVVSNLCADLSFVFHLNLSFFAYCIIMRSSVGIYAVTLISLTSYGQNIHAIYMYSKRYDFYWDKNSARNFYSSQRWLCTTICKGISVNNAHQIRKQFKSTAAAQWHAAPS